VESTLTATEREFVIKFRTGVTELDATEVRMSEVVVVPVAGAVPMIEALVSVIAEIPVSAVVAISVALMAVGRVETIVVLAEGRITSGASAVEVGTST